MVIQHVKVDFTRDRMGTCPSGGLVKIVLMTAYDKELDESSSNSLLPAT